MVPDGNAGRRTGDNNYNNVADVWVDSLMTTTICVEQDVFMLDANKWQLVLFTDVLSRASGRRQHLRRVQYMNGSMIWFAINRMQVLVPM